MKGTAAVTPMDHQSALHSSAAERYVLGQMTENEQTAFELHFFECDSCASDVEHATQFAENTRAAASAMPAASPVAASKPGWLDRLRALWREPIFGATAAASALLAVLAVYQGAFRIPALESRLAERSQPGAFLSYPLKAETRGEANVISVPRAASYFALQMDLPEIAHRRYRCTIRQDNAAGVRLTTESDAPSPGMPLNLLLNAGSLPPGAYLLNVDGIGAGGDSPVAAFRFVLEKEGSPR